MNFVFSPLSSRVIFGSGSVAQAGAGRLSGSGKRGTRPLHPGAGRLGAGDAGAVGIGRRGRVHPAQPCTCRRKSLTRRRRRRDGCTPDFTVAIGGGSTTGPGQGAVAHPRPALARHPPPPTPGLRSPLSGGMTKGGLKTTGRDPEGAGRARSSTTPDLTASLPVAMSVASGLNAVAHCMGGPLHAVDGNPIIELMAEEGLRVPGREPANDRPRAQPTPPPESRRSTGAGWRGLCSAAQAWRCTTSSATRWGGSFDLPHAQTHSAVPAARHRLQRTPPVRRRWRGLAER